jgi:hypothetical protein
LKKLLIFILCAFCCIFAGCLPTTALDETTEVVTTTPETTVDMTTADALLKRIAGAHLADEDFIDIVKQYVPDIHTLVDFRAACWTYFLVMEDGTEYIIITDYDGRIDFIGYWLDGYHGDTLYERNENDKPFET